MVWVWGTYLWPLLSELYLDESKQFYKQLSFKR